MGTQPRENFQSNWKDTKKAMHILTFKGSRDLIDNLYKESNIDKLKSTIIKANSCFAYVQNNLPGTFSNFFTLNTQLHKHSIRHILPNVKTTSYGSNSITLRTIKQWDKIQIFIKTDIYSSKMAYSKCLKSAKSFIKSKQ